MTAVVMMSVEIIMIDVSSGIIVVEKSSMM